jgi:hypothetical protein
LLARRAARFSENKVAALDASSQKFFSYQKGYIIWPPAHYIQKFRHARIIRMDYGVIWHAKKKGFLAQFKKGNPQNHNLT